MKLAKLCLSIAVATALLLPLVKPPVVNADAGTLLCATADESVTSDNCDLAVSEQVQINETEPVNALSSGQAVTAKVGDTITWTITVNTTSDTNLPDGTATVSDTLPSQVSFVSATASTGSYSDNDWTFSIGDELPATLVLVTTATGTGLFDNAPTLSGYVAPCYFTQDGCVDPPYNDANATNNTGHGYVNIPAPTTAHVLGASTVKTPDTGFGIAAANPWIDLLGGSIVGGSLLALARRLQATPRK